MWVHGDDHDVDNGGDYDVDDSDDDDGMSIGIFFTSSSFPDGMDGISLKR